METQERRLWDGEKASQDLTLRIVSGKIFRIGENIREEHENYRNQHMQFLNARSVRRKTGQGLSRDTRLT